jgi:pimaricinolide synthase PimS1
VAGGIELRDPEIPIVSNASGALLQAGGAADPAYWVAHARQAVRFADGISTLLEQGVTTFLEIGPGGALTAMTGECLQAGGEQATPATAIPTLREGRSEPEANVHAHGSGHAAGAKLDWHAFFAPAAKQAPLPTYAFQRTRYWLNSASMGGDVGGAGLSSAEHPLLGASVDLAAGEGDGTVFTGRLSLASHPWLADHAISRTPLVPATALLELALEAGAQLGVETVEELTLQAPLILPESGAVQIQLSVAGADDGGRRQLAIHSRLEGSPSGWDLNAEGALVSSPASAPAALDSWPPEGAERIDTEGIYDLLADLGVEYGPSFQGLVAAWRVGETAYAEVSLGGEHRRKAGRFRIHPALLDAAAHAVIDPSGEAAGSSGLAMPFAWQGVRLYAPGADALRVRIAPGSRGSSLVGFDEAGEPAISIEAALSRPVKPGHLGTASRSLYRVAWKPVQLPSANGTRPRFAILGEGEAAGLDAERHADLASFFASIEAGEGAADTVVVDFRAVGAGEGVPVAALEASSQALELAKAWVASEAAPGTRLTFLTQGAVAGAAGDEPGLAAAPLWGLLRSAQSEHPGRFALVDLDGSSATLENLPVALAAGEEEPQLAMREGELLAPRLSRVQGDGANVPTEPLDPGATILITGGTTGLGAMVARHLVTGGARHLLLVSRRGAGVPGAKDLQAELARLGAETVRIEACDVADRGQLEALLGSIAAAHPLGAVIHSAAVVDDGVLDSLDAQRLARVMAPKAEAAWHLHELTEGMELSRFVLFSSVAGVLGGPGQANYAAASTFLDALAAHRQAEGLAATSLAWGALGVESDLLGGVAAKEIAEQVRLRGGLVPMPPERVLALFDTAGALGESLLVPIEFDWSVLRSRAKEGSPVAPLLRDLLRVTARPEGETGSLVERLAGVAEGEREAVVVDLVRRHAAAVLGHASVEVVEPDRAFQELGFDSLAAVELRNRLGASTGLSLPPTLVFDYPSVAAIAGYLLAEVSPGSGDAEDAAEIAFREALARTPLARLREAGLMEDLVEIVGLDGGSARPPAGGSIEQLDSMDAAGLIERTLKEAELAGGDGG